MGLPEMVSRCSSVRGVLPAASAMPVTTPLVPLEADELALDVVEPPLLAVVPVLLLLLYERCFHCLRRNERFATGSAWAWAWTWA